VEDFRLLAVHSGGDTVFAVLPHRQLMGQEYREQLEHDFRRLSQLGAAAVRLDLRAVEFIDGAFTGLLIRLVRALAAGGACLTVEASPNLVEVFQIIKLDRLFEVIPWKGETASAGSAEPPAPDD
jgi:anti-anti-sigma regulatory factor